MVKKSYRRYHSYFNLITFNAGYRFILKNEYEQLTNNLLLSIKMNIDHWYYSFGKDPDLLLLNPIAYYFISRTNDIDSINGTLFGVKIHTITSS